jgi:hypothetical protein
MIGGLIRGKASGGVRRVYGRWAHMRCNASKVERLGIQIKKWQFLFCSYFFNKW